MGISHDDEGVPQLLPVRERMERASIQHAELIGLTGSSTFDTRALLSDRLQCISLGVVLCRIWIPRLGLVDPS